MSDGIILNFVSPLENKAAVSHRSLQSTNKSVKGWRQKRIQAKVQAHRINRSSKATTVKQTPVKPVQEKPVLVKAVATKVATASVKVSTASSQKNYISSLFKSNPEIPQIEKIEKTITKAQVFNENATFGQLGLVKPLVDHLKKLGIEQPTNIQRYSLPYLLNPELDNDFIVKAQTGSGKTLSFLLPILNRLILAEKDSKVKLDRSFGTFALILAPTRELAQQIYSNLEQLLNFVATEYRHWIVAGLVIGGDKKKAEKARIRKGVNILVSTPGRLLDHLKTTKSMKMSSIKWLVLDEADRLLELGFEDTLSQILALLDVPTTSSLVVGNANTTPLGSSASSFANTSIKGLPSKRQTILCSATINGRVEKLLKQALNSPILIQKDTQSSLELNDSVPLQLDQKFVLVPAKLRLVTLIAYLKQVISSKAKCKILVFVSSCDSVEFHQFALKEHVQAFKLHGNLSQATRQKTSRDFSKSTQGVLICTDVAARGLDIPGITHIVQYDPPTDTKDYVHRAGRTARIGKEGNALLFLLPSESEYVGVLRNMGMSVDEADATLLLNGLVSNKELSLLMQDSSKARIREKLSQDRATEMQLKLEKTILESKELGEIAKKAFASHIRAYATHSLPIFHIKKLHLGHVAKSFGLREAPGKFQRQKEQKEPEQVGSLMKRRARALLGASFEEFGDGGAFKKRKS